MRKSSRLNHSAPSPAAQDSIPGGLSANPPPVEVAARRPKTDFMPKAGNSLQLVEHISPVVVTDTGNDRSGVSKLQLIRCEAMVEFPRLQEIHKTFE